MLYPLWASDSLLRRGWLLLSLKVAGRLKFGGIVSWPVGLHDRSEQTLRWIWQKWSDPLADVMIITHAPPVEFVEKHLRAPKFSCSGKAHWWSPLWSQSPPPPPPTLWSQWVSTLLWIARLFIAGILCNQTPGCGRLLTLLRDQASGLLGCLAGTVPSAERTWVYFIL